MEDHFMHKKFISLVFLVFFIFFTWSKLLLADTNNKLIDEGRFGITGLKKPAQSEEALSIAKKAGITWTRLTVAWDAIEPVKGTYNWSTLDNAVIPLLKKQLGVVIDIRSYSRWASAEAKLKAPKNKPWLLHKSGALPDEKNIIFYKKFINNLVERYDGDDSFSDQAPPQNIKDIIKKNPVRIWQIENEPGRCNINIGTTFWNGTAEQFARLIMITSDSIKKADPKAMVMLSGFGVKPLTKCCDSGYPNEILKNLSETEAKFDIFDIHNYRDEDSIYEQFLCVNKLLQKYGFFNVKIWMTETDFNWRNLKLGIDQETYNKYRAAGMIKRHVIAFSLGIEKVFQWTFSDKKGAQWPPKTKSEFTKFRGIVDTHFFPKFIYHTYNLMISKIDGFTKVEEISQGTSKKVFKFLVNNISIFIAWSDKDKDTLFLNLDHIKITDPFGNVTTDKGKSFPLTKLPVFIEKID